MIAKGDKSLPDDEEDRHQEHSSGGKSPANPVSGKGEGFDEYPIVGGDKAMARLIDRARRNRWGTSRRMRRKCVEFAEGLIDDGLKGNVNAGIEGVTLALRMEGQNQKDQLPTAATNVTNNVVIVESDDWYGNNAHDLITKAAAASGATAALPGTVQDAGVRPTVGKNGTRPASDN